MVTEQRPDPAQSNGRLVLMLHGFPESWYSWRHQFAALAGAGYHAVAPDLRGYGGSDRPEPITAYDQVTVMADIAGLVPALGYDQAIVIGHDWGAPTAWGCAEHHADRFSAVAALSVPFSPRPAAPPLDALREAFAGRFFYQLYFQAPGVAEAEFEADLQRTLGQFLLLLAGSGDVRYLNGRLPSDNLLGGLPPPEPLPSWLHQADLDFYVDQFRRRGLRGPLNYYRNLNRTWERTAGATGRIEQPAAFIAGSRDPVILMAADACARLAERIPNLRVDQRLPGVGHWTQQEAPAAVNAALLEFLAGL